MVWRRLRCQAWCRLLETQRLDRGPCPRDACIIGEIAYNTLGKFSIRLDSLHYKKRKPIQSSSSAKEMQLAPVMSEPREGDFRFGLNRG